MSHTLIDPIKHFNKNNGSLTAPKFRILNHIDFSKVGEAPYRSFYCSIFIFNNENAEFNVGSSKYLIKTGDIALVGPGLPYHWPVENGLEFDAILFNETVFGKTFDNSFFYMLNFFCPDAINVMQMGREHQLKLFKLLETLKALQSKQIAIPGLLHAILMLLQEQYNKLHYPNKKASNGKEYLVSTFRLLLSKHFTTHKSVAFYASAMNITPKYLSEILLAETGWTTKKWIEHHLSIEAKTLLNYSKLSIKEVSYQLGYDDVSHFTKAFKKWNQLTPGEFVTTR